MALDISSLTAPLPLSKWPSLGDLDRPTTLDALLRQTSARFAERVLWQFIDHPEHPLAELTYREVNEAVDRFARALARLGVTQGTHVVVLLANVPEFSLLWLAIARLGAVIVPLNPAYTPREIDHAVTKSRASFVITDVEHTATVLQAQRAMADLDDALVVVGETCPAGCRLLRDLLRGTLEAPVPVPARALAADDLLNIQFTSGTTGLPKGCMLTQAYWVLLGLVGAALAGSPHRTLADHPFFYMSNQGYLITAMWAGGRIVVTSGLSRSRFLGWVDEHKIDFAWHVDVMDDCSSAPGSGTSLKFVPSVGVHGELHAAIERYYDTIVRDWYGSTEAGMVAMVPAEHPEMMAEPNALGVAAPLRETRVVDAQLNDVAAGTPGELCTRGPGMMLGYYDEPAVNARTFFDGGWFRTGDLCTKRADGTHFFHGRIKDSISRSGENISAAEVEQVLAGLPGVAEAAVIGVADATRGQEVKAYVVAEGDAGLQPAAIFAACREQLAAFKVPRYLEFISELPRTGSGKVSKGQLRDLKDDHAIGAHDRLQQAHHAA